MAKRKQKRKNGDKGFVITAIAAIILIGMAYLGDGSTLESSNYIDEIESATGAETTEISTETDTKASTSYELEDIPEYSGEIYVEINNNQPYFEEDEYTTTVFENYSELDELGRCGVAYANICKETMPPEGDERGDISSVKPTGWVQKQYDGTYLYNRCHLIGYQLSDENANEKNLITGTRYFNVSGMLPFENQVAEYINNSEEDVHVLYRVTPIFEGENLVATGVEMEAYSVEDSGDGICFNVFVYNIQPGITIDYSTGESIET